MNKKSLSPLIEAKKLYKSFPAKEKNFVLADLSLSVEKGSAVAITGASGEGKTTLLHILGSLESFDQGEIYFRGKRIHPTEREKFRLEEVGFIFQSYNLLDDFSLLENVLLPAKIARKSVKKESPSYKEAIELIDRVELKNKISLPAKILSGGEKQRVAIARALMNDPEIILADELTGSLDHKTSLLIHELLLECVREKGKTLIVATHDKELVSLCDKQYLLTEGKLIVEREFLSKSHCATKQKLRE